MTEKFQVIGEDTEQKQTAFEKVERSVQAYLQDPTNGNPSDLVNTYFKATYDSNLGSQKVIKETAMLLFDTRSRLLNGKSLDLDPQFGTPGTIAMKLPYFYPLHTTIFGWYVEANIKIAQNYSPEEKEKLARKLREDTSINFLIQNEKTRVERRLSSLVSPSGERPSPWYKRFIPFSKK